MLNTDFLGGTEVRKIVDFSPKYKIVEYVRDMSVTPGHAETAYFMATMNVHLKQLAVVLNKMLLYCRLELCSGLVGE